MGSSVIRVSWKLDGWKNAHVPLGERFILIPTFLSLMPTYYFLVLRALILIMKQ